MITLPEILDKQSFVTLEEIASFINQNKFNPTPITAVPNLIPFADVIVSGTLTIGRYYEIRTNNGSDFTSCGAADNNVGTQFKATDTTPTWGTGTLYEYLQNGTSIMVTGDTQIETINIAGFLFEGSVIRIIANSELNIKNNIANTGTNIGFRFASGDDIVIPSETELTLQLRTISGILGWYQCDSSNDTGFVHIANYETITGIKTFKGRLIENLEFNQDTTDSEIPLFFNGNVCVISGASIITHLSTEFAATAGVSIKFKFWIDSTIKNLAGAGSQSYFKQILIPGGNDYNASSGDILEFIYDGVYWNLMITNLSEITNNSETQYKGVFADEATLLLTYPNSIVNPSDRLGWYIQNADTDTFWIWGVSENMWLNTGSSTLANYLAAFYVRDDIELNSAILTLNNTYNGGFIFFHADYDITLTKNYEWHLSKIVIDMSGRNLYFDGYTITIRSESCDIKNGNLRGEVITATNSQKCIIINYLPIGFQSGRYKFTDINFYNLTGISGTAYPLIEINCNSDFSCNLFFEKCTNSIASYSIDYNLIKISSALSQLTIQYLNHISHLYNSERWALVGTIPTTNFIVRTDNSISLITTTGLLTPTIEYIHPTVDTSSYVTLDTDQTITGTKTVDVLKFDNTPTVPTLANGLIYWDNDLKTLCLVLDATNNVILQLGQENHVKCVNKTGVQIDNGKAVYLKSAQGNRPTIELAKADALATCQVIGITTQNIADNAEGNVTIIGTVDTFDTSSYAVTDTLYLSAATAGELTKTAPTSPNFVVEIGRPLNSTNNGKILVNVKPAISNNNSLSGDSSVISVSEKVLKYNLDNAPFKLIGRYGLVDNAETSISFNDSTYVFTLTSVGTTWRYFRNGELYTITGSKTVTITGTPPAKGTWFIYIDGTAGTLIASQTGWTLQDTKVPVAIVEWDNALTPKYFLADERHMANIDRADHYWKHLTQGSKYLSGGDLSGYSVAPSSPTDANNTFGISEAAILDENLKITLAELTDPTGTGTDYMIMYKSSGNWVWETSGVPFRYTTSGYIQYDNAGTMTQGAQSRFYNVYLLFTNYGDSGRFMYVHGKSSFTSLALAQAENPLTFTWTGFPIKECVIMRRLTFETNASYTTKGKCRFAAEPQTINIPVTAVNVASVTKVWEDGYIYTISGEIKVPSGDTDFIIPFYVPVTSGMAVKITRCIHIINSGTSVTATLKKNNVAITDFTNMSITTTVGTTTASTPIALADLDYLALVVTAVSGTPKNLSFNIMLEKTV